MDFIDLKTQYRLLKERIDARIHAVLDRGSYVMGPEVGELEEALARFAGVPHAITMASGTDALLAALLALDVGRDDEVVTTPFTFIATAETIALIGARPVFVDIDPATYNIDPARIEAAITPRTRALVAVSLYGQCANLDAINAIAARHGLPVIEDAAQSFGARTHGRPSCSLTTIACTSFYPAKPLGCYGDGGAAFTADDALAARLKRLRDHGQQGRYHHVEVGINGRLDTLQAAVLLEKLAAFPGEIEARDAAATRYAALLGEAGIPAPRLAPGNTSTWAQYTVEVDARAEVQQALAARGVPTAVHYPTPLHLQPAFAGTGPAAGALPVAERAAERVMSLPMHPWLAEADQRRVVAALAEVLAGAGQTPRAAMA